MNNCSHEKIWKKYEKLDCFIRKNQAVDALRILCASWIEENEPYQKILICIDNIGSMHLYTNLSSVKKLSIRKNKQSDICMFYRIKFGLLLVNNFPLMVLLRNMRQDKTLVCLYMQSRIMPASLKFTRRTLAFISHLAAWMANSYLGGGFHPH